MDRSIKILDKILTNIGYGRYQIAMFVVAVSFSFPIGSEFVLLNLFQEYLTDHLDYSDIDAIYIVTIINCGQLLGILATYLLSDKVGRLFILKVSLVIIIVFGAASAFVSNNVIVFAALRAIVNFGIGFTMSNTATFMVENSPNNNRGFFAISYMFFVPLGQVFALFIAYMLMRDVDGSNWELTFGLSFTLCIVSFFPMFFYLKESPWFLIKTRKVEECIDSLNKISLANTGDELAEEDKEFVRNIEINEILNKGIIFDRNHIKITLAFIWLQTFVHIGISWPHILIPLTVDGDDYFIVSTIATALSLVLFIVSSIIIEMKVFGRKDSSLLYLLIITLVGTAGFFLPISSFYIGTYIAVINGVSFNVIFILRVFLAEFYETEIRTSTMSIVLVLSRVHMVYFPIVFSLITNNTKYSLLFFGIGGLFSCLTMLVFKEDTLGKHLDYNYNARVPKIS